MVIEFITKFLIGGLIILTIILFKKHILKKSKLEKNRFFWKGILIWILIILFFSVILTFIRILMIESMGGSIGVYIWVNNLIFSLMMGFISGWLIMLLLLKKIKRRFYVGGIIGLLIFLLDSFILGFSFSVKLLMGLFGINFFIENEWFHLLIPLVFIIVGGLISFIITKLKN